MWSLLHGFLVDLHLSEPYSRVWAFYQIQKRGFYRTSATVQTCQQRALTHPDNWFCPIGNLHVLCCYQTHQGLLCVRTFNSEHISILLYMRVKYERTDALSLWHQQKSTTVDIHGPLQTRGETRCPGGVSVSFLASRIRHECPRHNKGYIWRFDTWCGPTL